MSKKIIASTSQTSLGCSFLDWSINYLTGQTQHLVWQSANVGPQWTELVSNPLTQINAHGHKKNHPSGLTETQQCVNYLKSNTDFGTLYPYPKHPDLVFTELGLTLDQINNDQHQIITDNVATDYQSMIDWLCYNSVDVIYLAFNPAVPLYKITTRYNHGRPILGRRQNSAADVRDLHDDIYFSDSKAAWKSMKLDAVWDVRERLALSTRPLAHTEHKTVFDKKHFWVDCQEIWFNGNKKILEILDWGQLSVNKHRYQLWMPIFRQWQEIQYPLLEFQYQHQHIVDSVVNGWDYPIDLSFEQEIVIQHCLIYQHNLNLKTWQLTKFPNNTKLLHNLLEPNTHPIQPLDK